MENMANGGISKNPQLSNTPSEAAFKATELSNQIEKIVHFKKQLPAARLQRLPSKTCPMKLKKWCISKKTQPSSTPAKAALKEVASQIENTAF